MEGLMSLVSFLKIFAIAFITEGTAEYLFKWIWEIWANRYILEETKEVIKETFKYVPMAVGIFLCFNYNLDIIRDWLGFDARVIEVGIILTGIMIGRGSNYIHDFWNNYIKPIVEDVV